MNLTDQVCSLELSRKLRELGVEQKSLFYWYYSVYTHEDFKWQIIQDHLLALKNDHNDVYSAFTVSELLELLPKELPSNDKYHPFQICIKWELHYSDNYMWHVTYKKYQDEDSDIDYIIYDNKVADCLAKMLIKLIENNHVRAGDL